MTCEHKECGEGPSEAGATGARRGSARTAMSVGFWAAY